MKLSALHGLSRILATSVPFVISRVMVMPGTVLQVFRLERLLNFKKVSRLFFQNMNRFDRFIVCLCWKMSIVKYRYRCILYRYAVSDVVSANCGQVAKVKLLTRCQKLPEGIERRVLLSICTFQYNFRTFLLKKSVVGFEENVSADFSSNGERVSICSEKPALTSRCKKAACPHFSFHTAGLSARRMTCQNRRNSSRSNARPVNRTSLGTFCKSISSVRVRPM